MPSMSGKTAFMEMLRTAGVRYIFGNPGTNDLPIMSSLKNYSNIKYVLEAQAGMADSYSSGTGQPMEGPGH